nr:pre-mRNA-splicing factor CWC22 homolog [Ipomoea batatas]GME09218.1 pre-mRNA-splicing factor CWC22 homolog [Ipomoea batatas]
MSTAGFDEAGHKLLKIKLELGQEMELCIMLLECCSQERTYLRNYGLWGQRFCMINKVYQENFEKCFVQQYSKIHRLETNKLRNVALFFAHLLATDALHWHVLAYIRLTEEDTTSSARIFIKILFQELSDHIGIRLLNDRLNDSTMQESFDSIFPKDNPKKYSKFVVAEELVSNLAQVCSGLMLLSDRESDCSQELQSMVTNDELMSSTLMFSMDFLQEFKATTSTLLEFLTDLLLELDLESSALKLKNRKNRLNLVRRESCFNFVTPLRSNDALRIGCRRRTSESGFDFVTPLRRRMRSSA